MLGAELWGNEIESRFWLDCNWIYVMLSFLEEGEESLHIQQEQFSNVSYTYYAILTLS